MKKALIIDLKLNNIESVVKSLKNLKIDCTTDLTKKNIDDANILVLPGVGSFPAAMKYIKRNKIDKIIYEFAKLKKKKIIGICLGMQLLFDKSYEFQVYKGLSLIKGEVHNLKNVINSNKRSIIPNIGWHEIKTTKLNDKFYKIINKKKFYFIHSFYAKPSQASLVTSYIEIEGKKITASVQKGNIIGFQFHPEKSGRDGELLFKTLMNNF
jgi:glutamine amidotransferase